MRAFGFQFLLLASLLSACDIHSVAKSDQALGRSLSVGAWLDPDLEPLNGCEALNGVWNNRGNEVRDRTIKQSVFAAAFGLGEKSPDTVFADTVTLAYNSIDGLLVSITSGGQSVAALNIEPRNISCGNPDHAVISWGTKKRISVDASGTLWLDEGRYPPPGTQVCKKVGSWTHSAPDGMATVIAGGTAILMNPADPTQRLMVKAPITGAREPVTAIYLQPGSHAIPFRVWFQAESEWSWFVPSADGEVSAELESCHVYAVMGQSVSTVEAAAGLFDLGETFDWRGCHPRENPYSLVSFDGSALTVAEQCLNYASPDWKEVRKMPPRVVPSIEQQTLRRTSGADAGAQP
jgi:hypothetical protein